MHKKVLITLIAVGLLVGTVGQVGASVSPNDQLSTDYDDEYANSVAITTGDLVVQEGDLSVGVLARDCIDDGESENCYM